MSGKMISDSTVKATKRTRICGPQSKHGCFTCKRRRIKCDEDSPVCQRCVRSKIECEGYPEDAPASRAVVKSRNLSLLNEQSDATKSPKFPSERSLSPSIALLDRCSISLPQDRLARVGIQLLSDSLCDQFEFTTRIFDGLLPQLSHAIPSVNAAASALGAIYELQSTTASIGTTVECNAVAATHYGLAIKAMQRDLQARPFGTVPLLMTCMLLACSELLLRRRGYSLMHIQASFELLEERRAIVGSPSGSSDSESQSSFSEAPLSDEDDISLLFRTFDIHSSTYADRRMPTMRSSHLRLPTTVLSEDTTPQSTGQNLISIVHSCLYFTSDAGQYKYLPASQVPSEILIEQGRHLGRLNAWLTRLDRHVMPRSILTPPEVKLSSRTHLLMLRNMCLSTIIVASTILSPYETAWDDYSWYFEEIVSGAEEIFVGREQASSRSPNVNSNSGTDEKDSSEADFTFTFTPLPGVIQPLFLTAFKYRQSTYRRRAADLVRRAGREGPWIGELVAAVAMRLIEVEEVGVSTDNDTEQMLCGDGTLYDAVKEPADIPESARISAVGMDANISRSKDPNDHDPRNWTARRSGETRVRFLRCKDVEGMLEADSEVALETLLGQTAKSYSPNGWRPSWKKEGYWEDWNEVLRF